MKRLLIFAMAAGMLASLTACGSTATLANSDYIYGQIDSVSGNDIVLLLADYNENAESGDTDSAKKTDSDDSKREKPEGFDKSKFSGEMPEGFDPSNLPEGFSRFKKDGDSDESGESKRERPEGFDKSKFSGEMPEGFDPSNLPEGFSRPKKDGDSDESGESKRERPEGFDKSKFSGEMTEGFDPSDLPEGFEKPSDGEMTEGFDPSKFGSRSKTGSSRYTLTGEQEELRIAVGTTVTTALGVETDFEALKSGDLIKCTVENDSDGNDVITAVWILEK